MEKKDSKAPKSWSDIEFDKIIEEERLAQKPTPDAGSYRAGNQASTSNAHPFSPAPNAALGAARGYVYSSRAGKSPLRNQGSTSTQISETRVWGEQFQPGPSSQKRHLEQPEAVNPAPDKRARQVSILPQEPDPNTVGPLFLPYANLQPIIDIPIPPLTGGLSHLPQAYNPTLSERLWNTNPGRPMGSFQNHNWNPNPLFGMVWPAQNPSLPPVSNPRPPQVQHIANRPYRKYHTRRHPRRSGK